MARQVLYAYVDGSDLHDIASDLAAEFEDFVVGRMWVCDDPHVVDQKCLHDPAMKSGDLPDWDLGLNLDLPDSGHEKPGWFADVIAIAEFLAKLTTKYDREFAIGIADTQTGVSEDLHYIESDEPGLEHLRAIIGVGETE